MHGLNWIENLMHVSDEDISFNKDTLIKGSQQYYLQ